VVQRTDRTLRFCLILLCAAPAAAVVLYRYTVVLPEVMHR
jgi:hypothetical protein